MIFIIVAMQCEAVPFIKKYKLKQIKKNTPFRVYENDQYKLVISGTGGTAALSATVCLLTLYNASKDDFVINCGICATYVENSSFLPDMYIASFLRNIPMKRDFYPDMIWKSNFPEGRLFTVNEPYKKDNKEEKNINLLKSIKKQDQGSTVLIDMEGAFVFEGASRFVYIHNIFILKRVSDDGDISLLTKSLITKMIEEDILKIDIFITDIREESTNNSQIFSHEMKELENKIGDNLRLSFYQKNELKILLHNYILRGHNPYESLKDYINISTKTKIKKDGKIEFEKIKKRLLEP